uniref:ATP synthase F0 subunit 8 n=1 Tax=Oxytate striatipes TaxID=1112455 RepID=A0A0U1XGW3_OXYST|nr:ATP synthase F0 subunit 8 [Oxytate striatipes]AIT96920.1 ATP synthase F0 subunit 8 [Oxytate striatipes]
MPQLMPLMWIFSVLMILLLMLVFLNMYFLLFNPLSFFIKKSNELNYLVKW